MSDRIPDGFIEVTLHFTQAGQDGDIVTSFGFEGDSTIDQDAANTIAAFWEDLMGNLSETCSLNLVTIELGSADPDNPTLQTVVAFVGEAGGNCMPPNMAFLIQKKTAKGGRRFRGRNYLPGVAEGAVDDSGALAAGIADGLTSNLADVFDNMLTLSYLPVLFHQSAPFTPTVVVAVSASPFVATQRKRLLRG